MSEAEKVVCVTGASRLLASKAFTVRDPSDHPCQIHPPTRSTPTPTTRVTGSSVAGSSGTIDRGKQHV
ncbi:hypothetical protein V6N13_148404 [Hibiscus sabdariffa]|uniref:Uncharacterized protein n=1 Tax=Hibiscus sabdariffa TaxID=183260 RepID=A0ABR2TYJ6_9ROSI